MHELEQHHVTIDTQGDSLNPHHLEDLHPALNETGSNENEAEERETRLRAIEGLGDEEGNGEVGIFKISHLGGHRYSGVMIVGPSARWLTEMNLSLTLVPPLVADPLPIGCHAVLRTSQPERYPSRRQGDHLEGPGHRWTLAGRQQCGQGRAESRAVDRHLPQEGQVPVDLVVTGK